jgi:hypothetical protein
MKTLVKNNIKRINVVDTIQLNIQSIRLLLVVLEQTQSRKTLDYRISQETVDLERKMRSFEFGLENLVTLLERVEDDK